jgi:hypothetical protein
MYDQRLGAGTPGLSVHVSIERRPPSLNPSSGRGAASRAGGRTMSTEGPLNREQVFVRPESAGRNATLWIVAGIGAFVFAAAGFVVAIRGRVGPMGLQGMTTLPMLLGIGLLTAGLSLLRTPRRVVVGPEGLTVEYRRGCRRIGWDEVGSASVETGGTSHRRRLNLTDRAGKSIVKLDESFSRFDVMASLIANHVEAKGDDTAAWILRKKARRQAALAFAIGLFMAFACGFVAWMTYQKQRADRLLAARGQPGEAEIVRRFTAPNGVTKRLEYRVVAPDGPGPTENVEVAPDYWDSLEGDRTVPVIVVPGEPGISHLEEGQVDDDDFTKTPLGGYALAALGGLMALFMLGMSPLAWNGWDLSHDSKTKTWTIKRYGKVVWRSGGKTPEESVWESD